MLKAGAVRRTTSFTKAWGTDRSDVKGGYCFQSGGGQDVCHGVATTNRDDCGLKSLDFAADRARSGRNEMRRTRSGGSFFSGWTIRRASRSRWR